MSLDFWFFSPSTRQCAASIEWRILAAWCGGHTLESEHEELDYEVLALAVTMISSCTHEHCSTSGMPFRIRPPYLSQWPS
jgi:hypothetical protein